MASRLIIDGNSVYEIDEECEKMIKMGKEIRSQYGQIQKTMQKPKKQEMFHDKSAIDEKTGKKAER